MSCENRSMYPDYLVCGDCAKSDFSYRHTPIKPDRTLWLGTQAKKEIERELEPCFRCQYKDESIYSKRCFDCMRHSLRQRKEETVCSKPTTGEENSFNNKEGADQLRPLISYTNELVMIATDYNKRIKEMIVKLEKILEEDL